MKLGHLPEEAAGRRPYLLPTEAEVGICVPGGQRRLVLVRLQADHRGGALRSQPVRVRAALLAAERRRWGGRSRIRGGCTTCTGTCRSGGRTGIQRGITPTARGAIRRGQQAVGCGSRGAASWHSFGADCRSAARRPQPPERPTNKIGFRVVLALGELDVPEREGPG